jgi:hypothetical protein
MNTKQQLKYFYKKEVVRNYIFFILGIAIAYVFWMKYTISLIPIFFFVVALVFSAINKDFNFIKKTLVSICGFFALTIPLLLFLIQQGILRNCIYYYFIYPSKISPPISKKYIIFYPIKALKNAIFQMSDYSYLIALIIVILFVCCLIAFYKGTNTICLLLFVLPISIYITVTYLYINKKAGYYLFPECYLLLVALIPTIKKFFDKKIKSKNILVAVLCSFMIILLVSPWYAGPISKAKQMKLSLNMQNRKLIQMNDKFPNHTTGGINPVISLRPYIKNNSIYLTKNIKFISFRAYLWFMYDYKLALPYKFLGTYVTNKQFRYQQLKIDKYFYTKDFTYVIDSIPASDSLNKYSIPARYKDYKIIAINEYHRAKYILMQKKS